MIALLWLGLAVLFSPFKSRRRLEAENVALRHQVLVLRRHTRGLVRLTNLDWLFLVRLYRCRQSLSGNGRSLASGRLSPLLALEIAFAGRAAADRDGIARFDPANEHR